MAVSVAPGHGGCHKLSERAAVQRPLAPRGSMVSAVGRTFDQPALTVSEGAVREAVGAGDAYDAGFLDALARGGDVVEAARLGSAAATLSLTGRGGADGIRDRAAVIEASARVPAAVPRVP